MRVVAVLAWVAGAALAQCWFGPFQLTESPADDINPAVCREWLFDGDLTCMVWQTNRHGNWDIYSRFCRFFGGNGWMSEIAVCRDSLYDDVNPAVCCLNDWTYHPSYWSVWERRESPNAGRVMAAFITFREQWRPPVELGRIVYGSSSDSAEPQVVAIRDTVWVAWRNRDSSGCCISYTYHDGDTWQGPQVALRFGGEIRSVRLGKGGRNWQARPLLVWEQSGDIFYSEYQNGGWTSPQPVAQSSANDRFPEIMSYEAAGMLPPGANVVWESEREGDTAIFCTPPDSFSIARRVCDTSSAGRNMNPCGVHATFTTDLDPFVGFVAWVSDRTGNRDIYSSGMLSRTDQYVDQHPGDDINPCLTAMGVTMVWCCWQSDRNGNWDLYGSYVYATGIAEQAGRRRTGGVVRLGQSAVKLSNASRLFDAAGRSLRQLKPGTNRLEGLAPAVYFLWDGCGVSRVVVVN